MNKDEKKSQEQSNPQESRKTFQIRSGCLVGPLDEVFDFEVSAVEGGTPFKVTGVRVATTPVGFVHCFVDGKLLTVAENRITATLKV